MGSSSIFGTSRILAQGYHWHGHTISKLISVGPEACGKDIVKFLHLLEVPEQGC